ncbi:hypothetical protein Tco_1185369 [Tanacetum coccineum]
MGDDTTADEQAYSSSGEDVRRDHIPIVNLRYNVSNPLPLGGDPGHVIIQPDFFFNKDLDNLRYSRKIGRLALSILKMKAAYYPDVSLEQMVPDQMWIEEECKYDVVAMYGISHWWFQRQRFYIDRHTSEGDRRVIQTHMRILSVIRIKVFPMYGYNYMKKIEIVPSYAADLKEYVDQLKGHQIYVPINFGMIILVESSRLGTQIHDPTEEANGSTQGQSTVSVEVLRNAKIKGEKKAASLNLSRNRVTTYAVRITWLIADIEDKYHGPSDTLHNPP